MIRAIIEFIVSAFRKPEIFSKNKYKSVYRKPGEISEKFREIKIPEFKKENKFFVWLDNIRKKIKTMSYNNVMENVRDLLLTLLVVVFFCCCFFITYKAMFTSGAVEYCYIERWTYTELNDPNVKLPDESPHSNSTIIPGPGEKIITVYELKGHVDFRHNREIGRFDNFDAALTAAQKINCPIEKK